MKPPFPLREVRRVQPPGAREAASCLGMGCASLGSRISPGTGLRALCEAHEAGVTWYDVAPAYGAGEAEAILADFLKTRRNRVFVATKVGLAPPRRNGLMRLAYTAGRPLIGVVKGLRAAFRNVQATRNVHLPLTSDLIAASLDSSLRRLGVERVDFFALHDPSPDDVARDDVMLALERAKAAGKVGMIGVAGKVEACARALAAGAPYEALQCAATDHAALAPGMFRLSHSVFGVAGMRARAEAAARTREGGALLSEGGYDDAASLVLDAAFARNPEGIVLTSMFAAGHLAANLSAASRPPRPDAPARLARLLGEAA